MQHFYVGIIFKFAFRCINKFFERARLLGSTFGVEGGCLLLFSLSLFVWSVATTTTTTRHPKTPFFTSLLFVGTTYSSIFLVLTDTSAQMRNQTDILKEEEKIQDLIAMEYGTARRQASIETPAPHSDVVAGARREGHLVDPLARRPHAIDVSSETASATERRGKRRRTVGGVWRVSPVSLGAATLLESSLEGGEGRNQSKLTEPNSGGACGVERVASAGQTSCRVVDGLLSLEEKWSKVTGSGEEVHKVLEDNEQSTGVKLSAQQEDLHEELAEIDDCEVKVLPLEKMAKKKREICSRTMRARKAQTPKHDHSVGRYLEIDDENEKVVKKEEEIIDAVSLLLVRKRKTPARGVKSVGKKRARNENDVRLFEKDTEEQGSAVVDMESPIRVRLKTRHSSVSFPTPTTTRRLTRAASGGVISHNTERAYCHAHKEAEAPTGDEGRSRRKEARAASLPFGRGKSKTPSGSVIGRRKVAETRAARRATACT
eukprot:GHVS01066277.1.p1 GENE.GHVS01066277.1~~GHVS01066277.1.p1  ORF type:complete len:488 (+),score=74.09 GHVS01066277.1:1028-2491(+)